MKYIIIKNPAGEIPIVFPEFILHTKIAEKFGNENVVSAGFVKYGPTTIDVYGESVGLGLKSRFVVDEEIIRSCL